MKRWSVILTVLSGLTAVVLTGTGHDGLKRAFIHLDQAETYIKRGADETAFTLLEMVMREAPGTYPDFRSRQLMIQRLVAWKDGNPPTEEQIDRASEIVHEALGAGLLTKLQCLKLGAWEFVVPLCRKKISCGRALEEAEALMDILDGGPPAEGELGEAIAGFYYLLGVKYPAFNRYDDTVWAYEQAITRYWDTLAGTAAHMRLGSYYSYIGDFEKAEEHFRSPLDGRQVKTYWEAHYYLGDFLVKQKRYAEALEYLDPFLEERPSMWEQFFKLAERLQAQALQGIERDREEGD